MNIVTKAIVIAACLFAAVEFAHGQQKNEDRVGMHGIALPIQQVWVRSTIQRQISKIHVEDGRPVKKGDVLIELDAKEAIAKVKVAELEANATGVLSNAMAEFVYSKSHLERVTGLFAENASNEREYEEARLRFKSAEAGLRIEQERLAVAQARHQLALAELESYKILAPFDGHISQVKANEGQAVTNVDDLIEVTALDRLRVELFLPVEWSEQLAVGSTHSMKVALPFEQLVSSTVTYQAKTIESTSGTVRFVFEIDNGHLTLPAGFSATLSNQQITTMSE